MGEHSSRYQHVAEAFSAAGLAMFGFDLRGHGKSGGPRGHFPSAETIINDIDLMLEHASIRYPGLPLILYGHSLGGILVLNHRLKRKYGVKGIIATSPGLITALHKQPLMVMSAKLLGSLIPSITIASGLDTHAISQDKTVVETYNKDPLVHNRLSLGFGKIMLGVTEWILAHAVEFSFPLLLLHGKSDTIAFPESSTLFAARVKQNCRLLLWENGYHELHNEPFKEEVFRTMINWTDNLLLN